MTDNPLLNTVLAALLVLLVGGALVMGKAFLLPIVVAWIAVYVLVAATEALQRAPILGRFPAAVLRALVLAAFTAALLAIAVVVSATIREIAQVAPTYERNLEALLESVAARIELDSHELWDEIRAATIDQIDLQRFLLGVLGGFTSVGATIFLIVVYAGFLLGERASLAVKMTVAFPAEGQADRIMALINRINAQVRNYITVKTLINVILGVISYGILKLLQVDFALFWAVVIALLNYIPYVGSYVGVAFPVLLSLAQFGDIGRTVILAVMLTLVQMVVGNFLEPRMIGRQLNLSPFVVLISLSFWTTLWGVPGAILAVPMTSILAITMAGFEGTRAFAVLLADTVDEGPTDA